MKFSIGKFNSKTLGGMLIHISLGIGIFMILGISYFYVYLPSSTNHGETITVPNIEGMHISELEKFLVDRNLRYEVNDSSYSEKFEPLTILKQYPAAGTKVKENRKIFISVNRINPPTIPMPDLIDGSLTNANAVLRGNELKLGRIYFVSGPFISVVKEMRYKGRKIEKGFRVPKGSSIDLVVEDGGNSEIVTPDLNGLSLEDAKVLIFGSNLQLGEIHVAGDTVNNGTIVILKQLPEPTKKLKAGDAIEVWVGQIGTIIETENEIEQ